MNNNGTIVATLSAGLFVLGLLVGTLVAMSEHSLAQGVIAALFALFGGSLIGFLSKLSPADQFKAAAGILAISIGTLVGVYSGIVVNQYELLSPRSKRTGPIATAGPSGSTATARTAEPNKYLRAEVLSEVNAIDQQHRNGMACEEAYAKLRDALTANGH